MKDRILATSVVLALATALGCGSRGSAPAPSEPDREAAAASAAAAKALEGSYTVVEMRVGGKPDKRGGETESFVIKDGKIVIDRGGAKRVMMYTVGPLGRPGHIDMTYPSDNKTTKGIYEIKENENEVELRMAFPEDVDDNVRPNDFSGTKGVLIKLVRKTTM